jgi:hypothetical protein
VCGMAVILLGLPLAQICNCGLPGPNCAALAIRTYRFVVKARQGNCSFWLIFCVRVQAVRCTTPDEI